MGAFLMSQQVLPQPFSLFLPTDERLTPTAKSQIRLHRLLSLLGAFLILTLGFLYPSDNSLAVDSIWAHVGIAGLFVSLFGASYWSTTIRSNYVGLLRGLCYVLISWTILLTFLNHFSGNSVAGLLLVYVALIVVIGIGAHTLRPVLQFAGFGLLLTAPAATLALAPYTHPSVLLGSMGTVALVESIAIGAHLSSQEQLRDRENRIRGLTNSVPGVVFRFAVHPDGTYEPNFVGDQAETVLGISASPNGFYEQFLEHVPRTHKDKLIESIDQAVNNEEPWRYELPFESPSGKRIWLLGTALPQRRKEELVFNGVLLDITDRKRAEKGVQDREQKTEALYAATERLLTAASREDAAERLEEIIWSAFAYPLNGVYLAREDALVAVATSPEISELMPAGPASPIDGESLAARAYRSGTTIVADDLHAREIDLENEALHSCACVPVGNYGVISIACTEAHGIDPFDVRLIEILAAHAVAVLERIDHEEKLVGAKEKAQEANRLKSALLANMSHEVRTPLTAITGFAEILKSRLRGQPATFSARILKNGRRLTKTLDSVLQLSMLEAGAYELDRETVDLNSVAAETITLRHQDAEAQGVTLKGELPTSPVQGQWSEAAVHRIMENLLDNALKFTPEGGTVTVRVETAESDALLVIEDTGVGISEAALPTVFDAFQQESEGLARAYEGSGLGLAIVKELVDLLEGSIEIASTKGEGTSITVRLPVQT